MKKIIILLFIFQYTIVQCQENLVLYNMPAIQQSMYANPGQMPQCRINVGLPAISSIYFNLGNSGFKFTDVVKKRTDDSLRLDIDNLINILHKNNLITQSLQVDILSFGFMVKQNYFSFSAIEKENLNFRYSKDVFNFLWNGNGAFLGEEMKFNFGLDATHYREVGIGYARSFTEKINAGIKLKLLTGLQNASIAKSDISFKTGDPYFDYIAKANIEINTSGIDFDSTAKGHNLFFNKQNKGLGVDLGGVYKFNDRFTFSGSIIDLGSIKWKDKTTNYISAHPDAEFTFDGVNVSKFINSSGTFNSDSALNHYVDSVKGVFKIDTLHKAYRTHLPTKLYAGANYKLNDRQNLGLLMYGQFFDKKLYTGVAFSYNLKFNQWLSASASYAAINRSYNNIGIGFALTGPVQFYAITDNIIGLFLPQSSKTINFRTGLNLCFGRSDKKEKDKSNPTHVKKVRGRDTDKDGIPDKIDQCPLDKGIIELNGCPDRDGDKVTDKLDSCPDIAGLIELNGCPDKDGDKIIDKKDSCPDVAGMAEFKGCPDTDGDKIINKSDSCPDVAGTAALFGCPDRDEDGVSDEKDKCPDEKGSVAAYGCPDKDADGIIDSEDSCPEVAGVIEKEGCPPAKLYLLDKQGNILSTAIMDKDGTFHFTNLDMDENTLFKLESYDVLISNEFIVSNGKTIYVVRKGADGYFHYENINADANKMGLMNELDIPLQLKKQDAEKVKRAMDALVFDSGKNVIRPSSIEGLDVLADLLKQNPDWRIKLSGHTDNKSSVKFNMNLSKKRVEAVRNYLVKKGIDAQRVVLKWYGPTKPIAPNTTEEGKQQNRRVEFLIIR